VSDDPNDSRNTGYYSGLPSYNYPTGSPAWEGSTRKAFEAAEEKARQNDADDTNCNNSGPYPRTVRHREPPLISRTIRYSVALLAWLVLIVIAGSSLTPSRAFEAEMWLVTLVAFIVCAITAHLLGSWRKKPPTQSDW
jgi:hypothetical protein